MNEPVLEAVGAGFAGANGRVLLRDVNLRVGPGEIVAVAAPAGEGKSLLLRVLCGLDQATEGSVRVLGRETVGMTHGAFVDLWREMGFVYQEGGLISNLTLAENVALPLGWRARRDQPGARARAEELCAELELGEHAHDRPGGMGLGVKKRAAVARALAPRPRLIFVDDPFIGSDPQGEHAIREKLRREASVRDMSVVAALSDLDPLRHPWVRLVLLLDGTVWADGPYDEVAARARQSDPRVQRFFAA
ncbi:MAG: ATP-binding cassette domain-containing protein [Myxococcota bacterium]